MMTHLKIVAGLSVLLIGLAGCDKTATNDDAAPTAAAKDAAGGETIAAGLPSGKFADAAMATGLDATLAGPGPYTVLAPSDAAFDKLPAGAVDALMKPEGKQELTGVLTYHILPGTMLAADIGKAIDAGGGKAPIATMGGGTLTASRDGDKIILADSAGTKAVVTAADQQRSNGVVHMIDAVLMPGK